MFKIGQNVVHNTHGVGIIVSIEKREFGNGNVSEFYVMEIQDCGAPKKCFVPVATAKDRLRLPMKHAKQQVLDILNNPKVEVDHSTWNRRYRTYMDDMQGGDLLKIAGVAASLLALRKEKDLSFGERKLLEQAVTLIEAELGIELKAGIYAL